MVDSSSINKDEWKTKRAYNQNIHFAQFFIGAGCVVLYNTGQDKLQGRLATQIFPFFLLTARKWHFRDKKYVNV